MKQSDSDSLRAQHDTSEELYRESVVQYYAQVTSYYLKSWGNSFHFCCFEQNGRELSMREAQLRHHLELAAQGGFCPGMKLLDIGCGVGGPALDIAENSGAHVTGINISPEQVDIARSSARERGLSERTEFVLADASEMPFPDESFDGIYSFEAICYMPDKPTFYRRCARVLRPGGVFLGQDWLKSDDLSPAQEERYVEPLCRLFCIPNMISLSALKRYVSEAGFEIEPPVDLQNEYDILSNWGLLENKIVKGIHGLVPRLFPPTLKLLVDSGYAVLDAVRNNAFVLGYWRAYKTA